MRGNELHCIYCLKVSDKSAFNKEHVIEDSLTRGTGIQNNLTLAPRTHQSCVCIDCNDHLGKELDQSLGRDSLETIFRSEHGLLKPKSNKPLPVIGNSPRLKIQTSDGIGISIHHESKERVIKQHPHVRIWNNTTKEYNRYPINKLPSLLDENIDLEFEIVNCSENDLQLINDIISQTGRRMKLGEKYKEPDIIQDSKKIQIFADVDRQYQRAIAKIAFNYLAYNLNSIDSSIVLKEDFHTARDYIRFGTEPEDTIVTAQSNHLESSSGGHLLEVALQRHGLRRMIIARVRLFNVIPWTVYLTKNYKGIDFNLRFKHFWDFDAKICKQLYV